MGLGRRIHCVEVLNKEPLKVGWYLGDTKESLAFLAAGLVDIAVTYNEVAEMELLESKAALKRAYGFRDHFMLVGPESNSAELDSENDTILTMFNKIVSGGNADVAKPPNLAERPAVRFLSRFDKSATKIKEFQLFITLGQVPWALGYSKWYHQYPQLPIQALQAASLLSEYTLTDLVNRIWLSSTQNMTSWLRIYKMGSDEAGDPLFNAAHVLLGANANAENVDIWNAFMEWVVRDDGVQNAVREFTKFGEVLFSPAPPV